MPTLDETPTEQLLDGRYRLGECVGRGGAAIVHRAEDVTLGRTVAVKIMRSGTDGPDAGARTRREMAALAAIDHPCLVKLLDAKVVPGGPEYLVMDFVDGRSLRERLDEGALTGHEVFDLASDLAEALQAVHRAGVVHRDIKPSNVLLSQTGDETRPVRAKLADFGIAQLLDGARMTSPGMVVGTPAYVAPEQARGAAPDPAADIFALGIVLVETLTGRRPYTNLTPAEAVAARQSVPPELPPDLDSGWARLLRRMTDLDPRNRPSAGDVAAALTRLGTPAVVPDSPGSASTLVLPGTDRAPGATSRRRRRRRMLAEVGAGSIAAILAATIWAADLGGQPASPLGGTPAVSDAVVPGLLDDGRASPDATVEPVDTRGLPVQHPADPDPPSSVKGGQRPEVAGKHTEKATQKDTAQQQRGPVQREKSANGEGNAGEQGKAPPQNGRWR